jgi:hypothetical protein
MALKAACVCCVFGVAIVDSQDLPADFDCKMKALAFDYAQHIQPYADLSSVHTALGLAFGDVCERSRPPPIVPAQKRPAAPNDTGDQTSNKTLLFVDAGDGQDGANCTLIAPCKTIEHALVAARRILSAGRTNGKGKGKNKQPVGASVDIILRSGTFFLEKSVHLGEQDTGGSITIVFLYLILTHYSYGNYTKGLTFRAYGSDSSPAIVSGGVKLTPAWQVHKTTEAGTIYTAEVNLGSGSDGFAFSFDQLFVGQERLVRAKW